MDMEKKKGKAAAGNKKPAKPAKKGAGETEEQVAKKKMVKMVVDKKEAEAERPQAIPEKGRVGAENFVEDTGGAEFGQTELVEAEKYLNTGSHIGTKNKSGDMKKYIYKVRKDGLNVLNIQTIDSRLKLAAKMLSRVSVNSPQKIVVVSRKSYGQTPVKAFAGAIGATALTGRFVPGTLTNPLSNKFVEPELVIVTDTEYDFQAVEEAARVRVPVIALVSTNNSLKNIDLAIPINNKGRKSLALAYWILAKEILKERGDIKSDAGFPKKLDDFEYKMKEGEEEERRSQFDKNRRFGRRRFDRKTRSFSMARAR